MSMEGEWPVTQRRKQATQLQIAEAALQLFIAHGPKTVTVEMIAESVGVPVATLDRYFQTKEEAIMPLLVVEADHWHRMIDASVSVDIRSSISTAITELLAPEDPRALASLLRARGLLRAAQNDPDLYSIWRQACTASEDLLAEFLSDRAGVASKPLASQLWATAATNAIRIGLEAWARGQSNEPERLARDAFAQLSQGIE